MLTSQWTGQGRCWGDGNVLGLDCGPSYMELSTGQNTLKRNAYILVYVNFTSLKRAPVLALPVTFGKTSSGNDHLHKGELERVRWGPAVLQRAGDHSVKMEWLCLGTFPFILTHSSGIECKGI